MISSRARTMGLVAAAIAVMAILTAARARLGMAGLGLDVAAALLAVVAAGRARRLARVPRSRLAWGFQVAAPAVWLLAPLAWLLGLPELVTNGVRIAAIACVAVAWWLTSHAPDTWSRIRVAVDSGLGTASFLIVAWDSVFATLWVDAGGGARAVVAAAIPLGALWCAGFVLGVAFTEMSGVHRVMPMLFAASLWALGASDLLWQLGYAPLWTLAWLLSVAATLTYKGTSRRRAVQSTRSSLAYAPYVVVAPAAAALLWHRTFNEIPGEEVAVAVAMVLLLIVRQHVTLAENRGLVRELARTQARLQHQATHDHLTGLAGRVLLLERLGEIRARGSSAGGRVAIVFMDLDGFKEVNDAHGHAAGDYVLVEMARRLLAVVHDLGGQALAVRMSGDEFALVLDGAAAESSVQVAECAVAALERPVSFDAWQLALGCSAGVADADAADFDASALMRAADVAMYEAKRGGSGGVALGAV